MDGGDPDTAMAYYMFVNHGWAPSKYIELPQRERALLVLFALREIKDREKVRQRR